MGLLRLYRILEMSPPDSCTALAPGGWTPLADPGREGRLVFRVGGKGAFETGWVVYFAGENPLPARVAEWPWAVEPVVSVESFETRGDAGALRRVLNDDGFNDIAGILRFPSVTRLAVTGPAGFPGVLRVNLGALPVRAWARTVIDQAPARPASLCAGAVQPLEPDTYTQQAQVYFGSGGDWFFGSNWHNPEPVPAGFVRRTGVREATLLLPVKQAAAVTIRVSAEPLDGAEAVALSLNGHALPRFPLRAGWNELAWPVAADAWRAGVNELSIHVSGAPATERTARPGPSLRLRSLLLDWSGTK
jgi:hypothetical protein